MRLHICGVRGSTPAPGVDFVRYGGNTSCVTLAHDGDAPSLILDAGTGLQRVSGLLGDAPFRGTILLGHLHWDHTHGLPFFRAGDRPDAEVDLFMPAQGDPLEVLSRGISPPHFPIRPDELEGTWRFHGIQEGDFQCAGFSVLAREIPHKGGRTFGYRVSDGTGTVAYLSDHSPQTYGPGPSGLGEYHESALALAHDADVLLHDAQYTAAELPARRHYGHAALEYAIGLAETAGVSHLVLFHHDPRRTDADIDILLRSLPASNVHVTAAVEGDVIEKTTAGRYACPEGRLT